MTCDRPSASLPRGLGFRLFQLCDFRIAFSLHSLRQSLVNLLVPTCLPPSSQPTSHPHTYTPNPPPPLHTLLPKPPPPFPPKPNHSNSWFAACNSDGICQFLEQNIPTAPPHIVDHSLARPPALRSSLHSHAVLQPLGGNQRPEALVIRNHVFRPSKHPTVAQVRASPSLGSLSRRLDQRCHLHKRLPSKGAAYLARNGSGRVWKEHSSQAHCRCAPSSFYRG